jgi:choloylglycine hydrolase
MTVKTGSKGLIMPLYKFFVAAALLVVSAIQMPLSACSDFAIETEDGVKIAARTFDWLGELNTKIYLFPRGSKVKSLAPKKNKGASWLSLYGYIGAIADSILYDGMNEKGLSFDYLFLPKGSYNQKISFQKVPSGSYGRAIEYKFLGKWILGNFATVPEALAALPNYFVWAGSNKKLEERLHISLHDASGNSAVVEYVHGELNIYASSAGVLTNGPTYPWQLTNLQNFVNLTNINKGSFSFHGSVLNPSGQGSGLLGIPGDWSSPSRFVRLSAFTAFAAPVTGPANGVNLAFHLLNSVDVPEGQVYKPYGGVKDKDGRLAREPYSRWSIVKDLTNQLYYFRSYSKPAIHFVSLTQMPLGKGSSILSASINQGPVFIDVTDKFASTANSRSRSSSRSRSDSYSSSSL